MEMRCPHCGNTISLSATPTSTDAPPWLFGFEYRSTITFWGLPLIHIATGVNPRTGLPRLARGVIAIGNFAIGIIAIGGIAAGGITLSGIGFGIFAVGGIALGWMAIGGIALGAAFALGGLALSLTRAIGGLPLVLPLLGSL
jgi:hypothetical protein